MTDREMAIQIGERLIQLEIRQAVLMSILRYTRNPDGSPLDFELLLAENETSPSMTEFSLARKDQLHALFSPATPDAEVIPRLHRFYLPL